METGSYTMSFLPRSLNKAGLSLDPYLSKGKVEEIAAAEFFD